MQRKLTVLSAVFLTLSTFPGRTDDLASRFVNPPPAARPQVYWMWMGSNISSNGITEDLEALKDEGFGGTVMVSLADICTPWAGRIANSPSPEVITFSEPWWQLVRHAAAESGRLGLEFGFHNCAGYESSGGPWITSELSMQEVVWSETKRISRFQFITETPANSRNPKCQRDKLIFATSPCSPCRPAASSAQTKFLICRTRWLRMENWTGTRRRATG